jgi:hypothetical protein
MEQDCSIPDKGATAPFSLPQSSSLTTDNRPSQTGDSRSVSTRVCRRPVLIGGLTGGVLLALGPIPVALFQQYNGLVSELRTDLKHFDDTSGENVKKAKLEKCRAAIKQCSREIKTWGLAKEVIERELKASEKEKMELATELCRLRERLVYLDGITTRSSLKAAPPYWKARQ